MEKKKIDDLFKEGLENPEAAFNEMHWDAMEKKLSAGKVVLWRKRIFLSLGAAAAILLLIVFFWPTSKDQQGTEWTLNKERSSANDSLNSSSFDGKKDSLLAERGSNSPSIISSSSSKWQQKAPSFGFPPVQETVASRADRRLEAVEGLTLSPSAMTEKTILSIPKIQLASIPVLEHTSSAKDPREGPKNNFLKKAFAQKGIMTILAAPDLTTVRGAGDPSVSPNIGLLYTQPITRKISISAGILYSKKNYQSPYSFYKPNVPLDWGGQRPSEVRANCDVLDVPLVLNYQVFNKGITQVSVGAGVSSYFMLREQYHFSYSSPAEYNSLRSSFEVRGENNHLMGVADLSLSVTRKVSDKVSVGFRPFVKLPLTGIGYGQTKLDSKGLAVTVNFHLGAK